MAIKNMTGKVFGKLLVVERMKNDNTGSAMWRCVCECGETRVVAGTGLRSGRNKSCGCSSPRFTSKRYLTHGMSGSRTFKIWAGMHARCRPSTDKKLMRLYYERGIRVDERWNDFLNFVEDMGIAPDGLSIDRIDVNNGYIKENCRWATPKQQGNNTRANHLLTYNGITKTVSEWSEDVGIKANTIIYRVRRGWGIQRCFEKNPVQKRTLEKNKRARPCPLCGNVFLPRTSQIKNNSQPYCSHRCYAVARTSRICGKL